MGKVCVDGTTSIETWACRFHPSWRACAFHDGNALAPFHFFPKCWIPSSHPTTGEFHLTRDATRPTSPPSVRRLFSVGLLVPVDSITHTSSGTSTWTRPYEGNIRPFQGRMSIHRCVCVCVCVCVVQSHEPSRRCHRSTHPTLSHTTQANTTRTAMQTWMVTRKRREKRERPRRGRSVSASGKCAVPRKRSHSNVCTKKRASTHVVGPPGPLDGEVCRNWQRNLETR